MKWGAVDYITKPFFPEVVQARVGVHLRLYEAGRELEAALLSTYFRLTYTCGLRPNEGRLLKRSEVDLGSGEVRIVNTKWHKSRSIVMSEDMRAVVRSYAAMRDASFPENGYFFQGQTAVRTLPPGWAGSSGSFLPGQRKMNHLNCSLQ